MQIELIKKVKLTETLKTSEGLLLKGRIFEEPFPASIMAEISEGRGCVEVVELKSLAELEASNTPASGETPAEENQEDNVGPVTSKPAPARRNPAKPVVRRAPKAKGS